jgi:hypothetical protein
MFSGAHSNLNRISLVHCSWGAWLAMDGVNTDVDVVAGCVVARASDGRVAKLLKNRPGPGGVPADANLVTAA